MSKLARVEPFPVMGDLDEGERLVILPGHIHASVYVCVGRLTDPKAAGIDLTDPESTLRWATLTRNDGHYVEIEIEDSEGTTNA